ncbi:MAG: amino acid adenylation domain-containing protein, partial [Cyanobacteria bacterium J06641_5]
VVPADIQYVEAHGTGTPLGDPIEVRALGQVYSEGREPQNPLLLASVKTNIGHTEVVSGLASVLKVVLAQQKQTLPPHLHFQTLNPEIDLGAIPAKILTQLTPWQPSSKPRLAAVNSFGMSGTNAHAILAETPPLPTRPATQDRPLHLLPLSGKTPQALRELVQRYQQYFVAHPDVDLGDLCFTAGVGRSHFGHRWAITAGTVAQMQAAIDEYLQVTPERSEVETAVEDNNGQTPPSLLFATVAPAADLREIGRELQRTQPTVRAAIARCNDCLEALSQPSINLDAATDRSPVALFAIQVALVELWRSWGIEPAGVLMLPGGEWLASWIVGAVSLERALQQTIAGAPVISDADLQTPTLPLYCGQTAQRLDSQQTLKRLSSEAFSSAAPPALKVPDGLGKQLVLVANGGLPTGLTAAAEAPWLASVKPDAPIWQTLLESLAALYQQGLAVDWSGFDRDYPRQRLPLPTYPFQRQRYWSVAATRGAQLQPPSGAETATTEVLPELPSLQNLQALEPAARSLRLETYLTARLARALGVEPNRITPQTPLQSLAVDSIVALELKFDLEKALGSAVELAMFLSSPTVAALAAQIIDGLATSTPVDLPLLQANPEARHQPFPLNEIQRAYWLGRSEAFELGNVAAHVYAEYASAGLDCDRLQTAFQHLIDRHDVLRTIVLPNGQQQVLTDISPYEIQVIDLTSLPPQEREVQLVACREELSHEVRDPEVWPLFTVQVVRLGAEEQRVLLSIDNLLVDGSSLSLLCQEWGELYQDLDATLPSLEVTFRDYVLALQSLETSALYARSRTYWQERLPALPAGPDLPLAVSPATLTRPRFQRLTARLPAPAWQQLQQQATQHGLTPSGILLAAFSEVLASWSKSRHFCLNLTTFNRLPLHPQVRELVGDFTNLTLLAVDYRNADKFARRAQQVQQQLWQDLEHSYISGVTVLRDAMLTGDNRQPQLMPVVFTSLLANARSQAPAAFGTDWLGQLVAGVAQTPQVWLDHQVYEDDGDLVYNWDTVIGLFPEGMVEAMFAAYGQLIETLAAPEAWQQEHPLPLPEPHQALQRQINQTQAPVSEALLQFSLAAWAQQQPQHPAVIATDRTLTYDDLHRRSNQVGHYLQNCGVRPNQLVAVSLPKGWEQVVAVYGILAAGAAYVPLDPELPAERRDRLLEQSGAQWVLSVGQIRDALTWPTQVSVLALDDPELETTNDAPLKPQQKPTDLAYIIYTSGSTGNPKGVAIDHRGAMNTILDINHRFGVGPQDRVFALSALSFDLSVYDIFGAIDAGGTIVMPPPQAAKDPAIWTTLLETHQVTIWNGVPALMQMLVTHIGDRRVPAKSSLRLVMMSGDWIPLTLPPQIQALWPQAQTVSLGGATEASIWSIFYPIEQVPPHWKSIPYGRPLTNQQFYVFDAQLQPCPVWVPGQLFIGGLGLAQGYWHDPEKTAASFITHPTTGERLYRTGDLGRYLPSGDIEFLGREDNQLQLRGYRIELGEIEAALEQHPEVRQAAVTIVGEADRGQQLGALVAPMAEAKPESDVFPLASLEGAEAFWNTLVEAGLVHAHSSGEPLDLPRFQGFWQYLQDLYHQGVGVALQQLGIFAAEGEALTVAQLRQRGQIHPRYQPWLQRACQQLVQQGWCQQQGLGFALARLLPTALDPQLIERVRAEAAVAMDLSPASTALLIKTVENLADLLTEQQHSAELYVAQEIPEVYQKQFESCNVLMAQAIANLVQLRQPESLRILEVGAGLGSTTKHILPLLPATGIEYHFTDISQYFLQRARQQFGDYEFLTTSLLNLEQAPTAQ